MTKETVDRIIGVSAILISLLTLIMFIYQTNIMHQQSRLSVTPRLSFSNDLHQKDSTITFSTTLINKGIGPAIIKSSKVIAKDQIYPLVMDDFFKEVFPKLETFGEFRKLHSFGTGSALSAGESQVLFSYQFEEHQMLKISQYLNVEEDFSLPFNIIIEYASMYEEEWRIDSKSESQPFKLSQ